MYIMSRDQSRDSYRPIRKGLPTRTAARAAVNIGVKFGRRGFHPILHHVHLFWVFPQAPNLLVRMFNWHDARACFVSTRYKRQNREHKLKLKKKKMNPSVNRYANLKKSKSILLALNWKVYTIRHHNWLLWQPCCTMYQWPQLPKRIQCTATERGVGLKAKLNQAHDNVYNDYVQELCKWKSSRKKSTSSLKKGIVCIFA